jgi:hypothetical protein
VTTRAYKRRGRYTRGSSGGKFVWVAVCFLLTAGLVVGGISLAKSLKKDTDTPAAGGSADGGKGQPGPSGQPGATPGRSDLVKSAGTLPRRLLFIQVSKYGYLNPLTGAPNGRDRTREAALKMAFEWRVPTDKDNNQVFVVSDTAPPPDTHTLVRPVLQAAYEKFFDSSRAQDRVVVYFGGHAVEKDGKAYLVPVEGDLDDKATLMPVEAFYAKLQACKATQKVVIWDVCRFNPQRGRVRPGSEPMTEGLHKALTAAPPGVQVVTTCQPGENALEFDSLVADPDLRRAAVSGSSFLEAMRYAGERGKVGAKNLGASDPIPVAEWVTAISKRAADVAVPASVGIDPPLKQTVTLHGSAPAELVAANPAEPPPSRFELPAIPKGTAAGEVATITAEFTLPPLNPNTAPEAAGFEFVIFSDEVMKDYRSDVPIDEILKDKEKYRFRAAVVESYAAMRDIWSATAADGSKLRTEFTDNSGKATDAIKKQIKEEQVFPAIAIAKLELVVAKLEEVAPLKGSEPKRWQAHHDYALGQAKARLAFMHEFDLALGNVLTEVLPPLDEKQGHNGYKLIPSERMKSKGDVKRFADEAQEHFQKLIDEHKGTPWAIQAKRDRPIPLGLAWLPFNSNSRAE